MEQTQPESDLICHVCEVPPSPYDKELFLTRETIEGLQGSVMRDLRRYVGLLMEAEELRQNSPELQALTALFERCEPKPLARIIEHPYQIIERKRKYQEEFASDNAYYSQTAMD